MERIYDIDDFLFETEKTAFYPSANTGNMMEGLYLTLGLTGEAGEVAEKIKKYVRDGQIDKELLRKEIGDVFWYAVRLCQWAGTSPSQVLTDNILKLKSRKERGTLSGNGDSR